MREIIYMYKQAVFVLGYIEYIMYTIHLTRSSYDTVSSSLGLKHSLKHLSTVT